MVDDKNLCFLMVSSKPFGCAWTRDKQAGPSAKPAANRINERKMGVMFF
jgi:hypothetical protein